MSAPSERPRSERERYRDLIVDGAVRLMQADWEARSVADTVLAVHRAAKQADEYAAPCLPLNDREPAEDPWRASIEARLAALEAPSE